MNHKGKDVNSDSLADQWDERSDLGHARINKGRTKGDDPEIDTAQTPKRFDGRLALQEKIRKTFADSSPNKIIMKKLSLCPFVSSFFFRESREKMIDIFVVSKTNILRNSFTTPDNTKHEF